MATMQELVQQEYAGTIIPSLKNLVDPSKVPTGAQLAPGFTPEQQQAQQVMQGGLESYLPWLTQAGQTATSAMQATGPGAAQAYMNPYMQQVVDPVMQDLERSQASQRSQQAQRQIQSGGFAGANSRNLLMDAELARAQGAARGSTMGGLLHGGWESALGASQQAAQTQANLAGGLGTLGQMAQTGVQGDVNQLFNMGEQQRQIQAAQKLGQYQTPFHALGQYAGILQGTPMYQHYQSPNPILTGISAAGSMGNLFG